MNAHVCFDTTLEGCMTTFNENRSNRRVYSRNSLGCFESWSSRMCHRRRHRSAYIASPCLSSPRLPRWHSRSPPAAARTQDPLWESREREEPARKTHRFQRAHTGNGHRSGELIYSGTMPEVLGGKGELSVISLLVRCGCSQVSGRKKLTCVDSHPDSLLGEWCNG